MQRPRSYSFDTRGFSFAAKCFLVVLVLFAAARYGTAFASEQFVKSTYTSLADVEERLEEMRAKRESRSFGEVKLLAKLQEYEEQLSTRTIGTASIDTLSNAHDRLIAADLTDMKLYLFEHGQATATLPILSKGLRGSRWETPTGLYQIQTKEEDHFSTIGEVHMPKSMQFFGNFFIHGWPTYPDGTPVPEGYSGGCIRLSTEDAAKVYDFASTGTPIFVWEGDHASSTSFTVGKKAPPRVGAEAFLIADIMTGEVYAERSADKPLPIASLSKLLTALVANETIHYDRTLRITADDRRQTTGTPGTITSNDAFSVGALLYPLLMESNNSVAYAFARYHGADNFVRWMNVKARAIGMEHTHMDDPSGISAQNTSTASDMFKLTRYIHDSQSYILNISREPQHTITSESGRVHTLGNYNVFAGNPEFVGGKTGYTDEARETMTAVFEVPVEHATATIAIVVLGTEDRKKDVTTLLSWFKSAAKIATSSDSALP
jgi:D-alanyl-D-alanine endopeptidase (penicillin-binding protein 7)